METSPTWNNRSTHISRLHFPSSYVKNTGPAIFFASKSMCFTRTPGWCYNTRWIGSPNISVMFCWDLRPEFWSNDFRLFTLQRLSERRSPEWNDILLGDERQLYMGIVHKPLFQYLYEWTNQDFMECSTFPPKGFYTVDHVYTVFPPNVCASAYPKNPWNDSGLTSVEDTPQN